MAISGGPIENFREGWAILPVQRSWQKPHYWRRVELSNQFRSLCGVDGALATRETLVARGFVHANSIKPLEPGDFMAERCRRCAAIRCRA